jgi:hypothetical protein
MKALSVLQMIFGALASVDSYLLAMNKTRYIESAFSKNGSLITDTVPPNAIMEYFLLVCGVLILVCAFFQMKRQTRFSGWQISLSIIITGAAAFFSIRASTIGHFEYSNIYYSVYALLVLGAGVVVIGLLQLIKQG